jgi:hypothetical protein
MASAVSLIVKVVTARSPGSVILSNMHNVTDADCAVLMMVLH